MVWSIMIPWNLLSTATKSVLGFPRSLSGIFSSISLPRLAALMSERSRPLPAGLRTETAPGRRGLNAMSTSPSGPTLLRPPTG